MELIFNISEIAIITGDNSFKSKRDYLIDFWSKNFKNDYLSYKNKLNFVKENDEDKIKKISLKNNLNLDDELRSCKKTKTTNELNTKKEELINKISELPEDEKKEMTKSINNVANTMFGIRNEYDICKIYEMKTNSTIIKDNKYRKKKIMDYNGYAIYIGGKIDGFNANEEMIIEIKNRMHKLFYNLRSYEKVQIMSYMYLFNVPKAHLVEALKKKENVEINIIDVLFDEKYMNDILESLKNFVNYFDKFIKNDKMKQKILKNEIEINFEK